MHHYLLICLSIVGTAYITSAVTGDPTAIFGPYTTKVAVYALDTNTTLSPGEDRLSVWYPSGLRDGAVNATFDESSKFKFISYAHGMFGGGILDVPAYNDLLRAMASFGYIIGATHQCSFGCFDDCQNLKHDPPCFGNYYKKQLAVFDWARGCSASDDTSCYPPFVNVDWSKGVGIAGHSMGGQATLFSSSFDNTTQYDIRAAVMHHAYSHSFPAPTIPFLDFTGEQDTTAPPDTMAMPIYEAGAGSGLPRGFVDKTLVGHHEPDITCLDRNQIDLLAQFSAAWFKLYLDKTPIAYGIDFNEMIYGTSQKSICYGGDGELTTCKFESS